MSFSHYARSLFNLLPPHWLTVSIIGGGSLRAYYDGTDIKDIDCFFRCKEDYLTIAEEISRTPGFTPLKITERCCEYRHPGGHVINLVGFIFGTPREHLDRFDFRCSQFVAWVDKDGLHVDYDCDAAKDAQDKLLYIQNNNGTERTFRRIYHYLKDYGYRLHPAQTIEQEDAFEEEFSEFDAYSLQGVHPSDFKEVPPLDMRTARRRLAALPVQDYSYTEG